MTLPGDYWRSFERSADSVDEYVKLIQTIAGYRAEDGARFAWRGISNANWPLYSLLVRRYVTKSRDTPPRQRRETLRLRFWQRRADGIWTGTPPEAAYQLWS